MGTGLVIYVTSWVGLISMLQLEGECYNIYLLYILSCNLLGNLSLYIYIYIYIHNGSMKNTREFIPQILLPCFQQRHQLVMVLQFGGGVVSEMGK